MIIEHILMVCRSNSSRINRGTENIFTRVCKLVEHIINHVEIILRLLRLNHRVIQTLLFFDVHASRLCLKVEGAVVLIHEDLVLLFLHNIGSQWSEFLLV